MTNISLIENKISHIQKYLKILQRYKNYSLKELESDIDLKGATERYLYLAVQATIDTAETMIAYKKLRKPTTSRDNFYILNEAGIISKKLTEQLAMMTGFRNIIAHDYEKIDFEIVYDILHKGLNDINQFIKEISQIIK